MTLDRILTNSELRFAIGVKVISKMEEKNLKNKDLVRLPGFMDELGHTSEGSTVQYVSRLRQGYAKNLTTNFNNVPLDENELRKIAVVLKYLGLPEDDPLISQIKKSYSNFKYNQNTSP